MRLPSISDSFLKTLKKSKSENILDISEQEDVEILNLKKIGNYRLGKQIGSGSFGKVIIGVHILTEEKVAIKILDKLILNKTPEDYQLVKNELSILQIVKHKNIIRLYEILETTRYIFIIMEYCEDDIMNYILSRKCLSEKESLKFFQQLINALYYLHSQNIAHRDIKIDNLLLDSNNDLKLIDFGLSTKYKEGELLNQHCGTIVYAAPEVLDYKSYHGMLVDVWSCGIVLFGMLSGFLPFGESNDEINKKMILEGRIKMPKIFSEGAKDLLKHMLDINPLKRYTLDDIIEHPWFNKNKFYLIPGIIVGVNKIPVDENILELCTVYDLDKTKVRKSIVDNKFNNESSVYYLLVQKLKKMGIDSVSDLCSKQFILFMYNENSKILEHNNILNNNEKNNGNSNDKNQLNEIKILRGLNKCYNIFNEENNSKEYLIFETEPKNQLRNNNKKYINIENNFKNNIIIFDDKKKIKEIKNFTKSRNNEAHRINAPLVDLRKKIVENNDEADIFLNELINRNTIETDRVITKGKLIENKNPEFAKNKKKKNLKIMNINFPINKHLNYMYFKVLNKNNKYKNINCNNKFKNNEKLQKSLPQISKKNKNLKQNLNFSINNDKNILYALNKNKGKKESKKILNTTKNKDDISGFQNLTERTILSKENNYLSYINKSKLINKIFNIPNLNINKINKNGNKNKESFQSITNKNNGDNNFFNNSRNKSINKAKNKSEERRKIITNSQRKKNGLFNKEIFINLYDKNNNYSKIIPYVDKDIYKEQIIKRNNNYSASKKYILDISINNDKKLLKSNIKNLIGNSNHLNVSKNIEKRNINNKCNYKKNNNLNMNSLILENNSGIINGYITYRQPINKVYDLKKNNNNNNITNAYLYLKNKIEKLNSSNINSNKTNTIVYNIKNNKINNSNFISTTKNNKKNYISTLNRTNIFDDTGKCYTSRINTKLGNKQLNVNKNIINSKINNISNSSIFNSIKEKPRKNIIIPDIYNNIMNSKPKIIKNYISKENNTSKNGIERNINIEYSSEFYKKKSIYQMTDLSNIPRKKSKNQKTIKKFIPGKIKKKAKDEKINSNKISNKYIQKLSLNKNINLDNKIYSKKNNINISAKKRDKNKSLKKIKKNILITKLLNKKELSANFKNDHNKNKLFPENILNIKFKINNLNPTITNHQNNNAYNINNDKIKNIQKKIRLRNIDLTNKTNKSPFLQFNNKIFLTLNN